MTYDEKLFLVLLGDLFIEIRARDDIKPEVMRRVADLFHNLPFKIQSGSAGRYPEETWERLYIRADELGLGRNWVLRMKESAENTLNWPSGDDEDHA